MAPGSQGEWISCSHCLWLRQKPCQRSHGKSEREWASSPGPPGSLSTHCVPGSLSAHCVLGSAPGSRSLVCPCVSVCRRPCACFVFRGKNKTNPRQTQSAFRHLPEPWKPVIPLDRKDFRLDLMSMSRGGQPLRAGREQSPPQEGVSGDPERTAQRWAHTHLPSKLTPTPYFCLD